MDKEKLLKEIKEEKELKINSILYDLHRENFVTAGWTLCSLIELQAKYELLEKMELENENNIPSVI